MKCYVNLEGFEKTETGERRVWETDNILTHCCLSSFSPSLFIWEKDTKHNNYCGISGFIDPKYVELIK